MDRLADLLIDELPGASGHRFEVVRITTKGGDSWIKGFFFFSFALVKLFALLVSRRVDVLHLNVAAYGSFHRKRLLAELARMFSVPYIVHIHSGRFEKFWVEAKPRTAAKVDDFLCRSAGIVVLGNSYRSLILERLPQCASKLHVVPNATPERPRRPRKLDAGSPLQMTFLGSLIPPKGTPQLIEALAALKERNDWTATLAGDGDVAKSRARLDSLGLAGRVETPGWLSPEAVDELLARSDIFILPSFSEGQPMAILEAFARGAAVITTPLNAILDVVRNEDNGLLIPPGNVDAIVQSLERLLDDHDLRERLAEAGFQDHRARFSLKPFLEKMAAIWTEAGQVSPNRKLVQQVR